MALTRTESQITWSSADSITLSAATASTSDAFTFDATDGAASIQVDANNAGTPASGDILNVRIAWTTGDVLGDTADDYDTSEHAQLLMVLDTYGTNTPGEDPARKTVDIPTSAKGFKLVVDSPNAATRNMVVRARVTTQRYA